MYDGIYYHSDDANTLNFAVQNTYYPFGGDECGLLNGVDCNGGSGILTAEYAGVYNVTYTAVGKGKNDHIYHAMIFVNDTNTENTISHIEAASGDTVSVNGIGHIRVEIGDEITLRIADISGTSVGTVYNWNFMINRIGN